MIKRRKWLILLYLLSTGMAFGQSTSPQTGPAAPPLEPGDNVSLHLQGKIADIAFDVTLLQDANAPGAEREGIIMLPGGTEPVTGLTRFLVIKTTVTRAGAAYVMKLDVNAQIPSASISAPAGLPVRGNTTPTVSYHNLHFLTSVILQPGKPVVVFQNGGSVTATLEKPPAAAPSGGIPPLVNGAMLGSNLRATMKIADASGASNFSGIMGGKSVDFSSIASLGKDADAGNSVPTFRHLRVEIVGYESDGLSVLVTDLDSLPTFISINGGAKSVSYHNFTLTFVVSVKRLGDPLTIFSSGDKTISLTLSKAEE